MQKKPTGLEEFVDRNRGAFDAFEPRPDLWDSIEQELSATPARVEESQPTLRLTSSPAEAPAAPRRHPLVRYAVAASVTLLVAAGASSLVPTGQLPKASWQKSATMPAVVQQSAPAERPVDLSFFMGAAPVAMSTAALDSPRQEIARAVQRMEAYYAAQILERQAELRRLEQDTRVAADWGRELASLDSTYRELKVELARNPDPHMVLDAMNRNLQIRLDILNQQLRTRERMNDLHDTPTLYADSR